MSVNQRTEQSSAADIKYTDSYKAAIVKVVKKTKRNLYDDVNLRWRNYV